MRTSSTDTASQSSAAGNPATPALEALRESLAKGGPSLMDFITHSSTTPEGYSVEVGTKKQPKPKPDWMKMVVPGGDKYASILFVRRQGAQTLESAGLGVKLVQQQLPL